MNKKIIAIALALNLLPALVPSGLNFGTTAAFAASSSGYITDIALKTSKDKTVNVYTKSSYSNSYKLSNVSGKAPTNLYAQVGSNVSKIKVTDIDLGTGCDSSKIYKGSTEIKIDDEIKTSSDVTLKIKTYSGSALKETYNLKIEKEGSSSSNDDIYLDNLSLTYDSDDIDFKFDKEKSSYDINVKNKVSYIKVCAEPEDEDYNVKINGSIVTDDDSWNKKVSLSEGKNAIVIKIKDDGDEREYDLNITRQSSTTSSSSNTTSNLATSLSEGWQQVSGNWYFIAPDGFKQTGWQKVDVSWYYMDVSGVMQTGWLQSSSSGKWYYLNPTANGYKGAMLKNTTISGYRIGYDGARTN